MGGTYIISSQPGCPGPSIASRMTGIVPPVRHVEAGWGGGERRWEDSDVVVVNFPLVVISVIESLIGGARVVPLRLSLMISIVL